MKMWMSAVRDIGASNNPGALYDVIEVPRSIRYHALRKDGEKSIM